MSCGIDGPLHAGRVAGNEVEAGAGEFGEVSGEPSGQLLENVELRSHFSMDFADQRLRLAGGGDRLVLLGGGGGGFVFVASRRDKRQGHEQDKQTPAGARVGEVMGAHSV